MIFPSCCGPGIEIYAKGRRDNSPGCKLQCCTGILAIKGTQAGNLKPAMLLNQMCKNASKKFHSFKGIIPGF